MSDLEARRLARPLRWLAVTVLCGGVIVASMAGCGGSGLQGGAGTPGGEGSATGSSAADPVGSAASAQSASAAGEPASAGACRSGRVELSYRLGGPQPGHVCLRAGAELMITLREAPGWAWSAVESLSPHVVTVSRSGHGVTTVTATARAEHAGTAELRWTSSFTGDRFGPPTRLWRLTVTVVP